MLLLQLNCCLIFSHHATLGNCWISDVTQPPATDEDTPSLWRRIVHMKGASCVNQHSSTLKDKQLDVGLLLHTSFHPPHSALIPTTTKFLLKSQMCELYILLVRSWTVSECKFGRIRWLMREGLLYQKTSYKTAKCIKSEGTPGSCKRLLVSYGLYM